MRKGMMEISENEEGYNEEYQEYEGYDGEYQKEDTMKSIKNMRKGMMESIEKRRRIQ